MADCLYPEKTEELKKLADNLRQETLDLVTQAVNKSAKTAVKVLDDLLSSDDQRIQLDAAKHFLKLAGAEIERHDLQGNINFIPVKFEHETDGKANSDKAEPRSLKTE